MSRETDIAWAAGLFEGEGCFSLEHQSKPRATLASTDLDVVTTFHRIVGYGSVVVLARRADHHKQAWEWHAYGDDFYPVFSILAPYLHARRLAKGQEIVAIREDHVAKSTRLRQCTWCGAPFAPTFSKGSNKAKFCSSLCGGRSRKHARALRAIS